MEVKVKYISKISEIPKLWADMELNLTHYYGSNERGFISEIRQVVYESVANVIEHAHNEDGRLFELYYSCKNHEFNYTVYDTGAGIPQEISLFDLPDDEATSSRGFFLMKHFCDELDYRNIGNKNALTFKKIRNDQFLQEFKDISFSELKSIILLPTDSCTKELRSFLKKIKFSTAHTNNLESFEGVVNEVSNIDYLFIDNHYLNRLSTKTLKTLQKNNVIVFLICNGDFNFDSPYIDHIISAPINFNHLEYILKKSKKYISLHKKNNDLNENFNKFIKDTRKVQYSLLPQKRVNYTEAIIDSYFKPCEYLGGDMFSHFMLDEYNLGFYIADVSGHGVDSAMFAIWLNRTLMPIGNNSIVKYKEKNSIDFKISKPSSVIKQLDEVMSESEDDLYLTMIYGILNLKTGFVEYSIAGHPPILIHDNTSTFYTDKSGPPVGMGLGLNFEDFEFTLKPGSSFLLYSDCVLEAKNTNNIEYGDQKLLSSFENCISKNRVESIVDDVLQFSSNKVEDDLSLLKIYYKGDYNGN